METHEEVKTTRLLDEMCPGVRRKKTFLPAMKLLGKQPTEHLRVQTAEVTVKIVAMEYRTASGEITRQSLFPHDRQATPNVSHVIQAGNQSKKDLGTLANDVCRSNNCLFLSWRK